MPSLTLYTNPMSRGRIARWMLEEVGETYEAVVLDYGTTMKAPEFVRINPMGKVPTLVHEDTVVTESAAILAYLADAFPDAGLAPPTNDRGTYYRWLFFAAGPVEAAVTNKAFGFDAPDKKMSLGYGSYDDTMSALETAVSGTAYICGDRFSAADVAVGSQLGWGMMFGTIDKRPAFEAYVDRMYARPAYVKASALDDAAMPKERTA